MSVILYKLFDGSRKEIVWGKTREAEEEEYKQLNGAGISGMVICIMTHKHCTICLR